MYSQNITIPLKSPSRHFLKLCKNILLGLIFCLTWFSHIGKLKNKCEKRLEAHLLFLPQWRNSGSGLATGWPVKEQRASNRLETPERSSLTPGSDRRWTHRQAPRRSARFLLTYMSTNLAVETGRAMAGSSAAILSSSWIRQSDPKSDDESFVQYWN